MLRNELGDGLKKHKRARNPFLHVTKRKLYSLLVIISTVAFPTLGCTTNNLGSTSGITINKNGMLLVNGLRKWNQSNFEGLGYKTEWDYEVFLSEGVASKSNSDYYIYLMDKNEEVALYFLIIKGLIYRVVITAQNIPLVLGASSHKNIMVGSQVSSVVESIGGKYEIAQGEEPGSYFLFKGVKKVSFYTNCERDELKSNVLMNKNNCRVEKILVFGDQSRIWD